MRRILHPVVMGGTARHRDGAHRGNAWLTPAWFVEEIRAAFGGRIDLDPCTEPTHPTKARSFVTAEDDGLRRSWRGRVFVNPPYSPSEPWIDKAIAASKAGARVYMLLPVRTDTGYQQRLLAAARDVLFIHRRLKFVLADGGKSGSPAFGSMVVGLNVSTAPLAHLGRRLEQPDGIGDAA